jgi:hypothetical protein
LPRTPDLMSFSGYSLRNPSSSVFIGFAFSRRHGPSHTYLA